MDRQQPFTIDNSGPVTSATDNSNQYVVYKTRWLMLLVFVLFSMSNAFQWIQYSIITNIISEYYGVPSTTVDWLSMLYMITYIPLKQR